MSFATTHAVVRFSSALSAIAFVCAAVACGGGGEDAPTALAEPAAAPAPTATTDKAAEPASVTVAMTVTVEGCALDRFYVPATATPVRALATDGRLLGHALSDGQGFALRLPAHGVALLQVDQPQGDSLVMRADPGSSTWEKCLLDEKA